MNKLKVVLTLLLALCCSLCMFACGGNEDEGGGENNDGAKNISEIRLEGQKKNFNEGDPFSAEGLKVSVYYQGDDDLYELTAEDYEINSDAYDADHAGQYIIYVIPTNQPKELTEGGKDNRKKGSYYVSVDHSWQDAAAGSGYQQECKCGAKKNSYTGLEDKIETKAWNNQATFTPGPEGKHYPNAVAPIAGENHVSYGSLIAGQSLELTLQITAVTKSADPAKADQWDTPLMGFRNGSVGFIPREDSYVIGTAKGFAAAEGSNIPAANGAPAVGVATASSELWEFYVEGTNILAQRDFFDGTDKWSTVVVKYDYQTDGVLRISHDLYKFRGRPEAGAANADPDATLTYTVRVPKAAYEVVVYGELCSFTITDVEFVAGLAITGYTVDSQPTNLKQPEGKLFDTTGLKATATFSDGSDLTENNFNVYAYRDIVPEGGGEAVPTKVNLSTEPLKPDMYDFFIEFNGMTADLSDDIAVIPTVITGAKATEIKVDGVSFEALEVAYEYAVTADEKYIRLTMEGTAAKATAEQAEKLEGSTHFIAFKLLTNLAADAFDIVEAATGDKVVAICNKVGNTVDIVIGLKEDFKAFDITFFKNVVVEETEEGAETVDEGEAEEPKVEKQEVANGKVQIDLSGLSALPEAGSEITESDFTLDAGGTYTVKYTGLGNDIDNLTLATGNARATVAKVMEALTGTYTAGTTDPTAGGFYRATNTLYIVKATKGNGELTVTYWLAAPDLDNLNSDRISTAVSIRSGDTVLASADLLYRLVSHATNIGTESDPVYVTVSDNTLIVYAVKETNNLANGLGFAATLNIEHEYTQGKPYDVSYNVGITVVNGAAAWAGKNALTQASTAKIIPFGTINDATDYDKGAIFVASLSLPALGVREDDSTRTFRFTANENTADGQSEYTIFTVKYNEEKETDEITSAAADLSAGRTELQELGCVQDGIEAYRTQDGFWFGALVTPATGAHKFVKDQGSETMEHCSECGYSRETIKIGNNENKITLEDEGTALEIKDGDGGNWWADPTEAIEISGDFAVEFKWENTDGNYTGNAALEFFDADNNYFAMRTFVCDYNPGPDTSKLFIDNKTTPTHVYTIDGEAKTATDLPKEGAAAGNATVLVWRVMNTLYVRQILVYGEHTLEVMSTLTGFTNGALSLRLNGNTYWCNNVTYKLGYAEYTLNAGNDSFFTYELTDGFRAKYYSLPNLVQGATLTVTGHHTTNLVHNWESIGYLLDSIYVRADNWALSAASSVFSVPTDGNGYFTVCEGKDAQGSDADAWAIFGEVARDCDYTLVITWKNGKVEGTLTLTGEGGTFTDKIELEVQEAPANGIPVQLSGEAVNYTVKTINYVR